jgi:serine/threonine-protein kinase
MLMDAFHPDHLKPGDMVGPWRIVKSLGSGAFGHVFKVERDGDFYTLKMAVRPAPELLAEAFEDRQVDGRMRHEAATLLANASLVGLPYVRAIDRWPHPTKGYLYIVMDYVPGEPFHDWRARARPNAAQLVDIFIEVVRAVAGIHRRGILIRDFKSEHVIISTDCKPVLVDMGSAWLPGGSNLTVGLAPSTPHMLPPECITFLREGAWKQGVRFDATKAGDLYQLGVFMFEALTDYWPFDPRMAQEELLVAIQSVIPRAPHRINPAVPESLSRITLKLLEKQPEDRHESAEALLQALWDAAKERSKPAWKVPLVLPPEGPAPTTEEEVRERRLQQQEAERRAREAQKKKAEALSREQALEQFATTLQQVEAELDAAEEKAARRKKWWLRTALGAGTLLLGLALFIGGWVWLAPATTPPAVSEKGRSLVSTLSNSQPVKVVTTWLCSILSVGCTAAQVRPLPDDCPQETIRNMEEIGVFEERKLLVILDIHQPGKITEEGVYRTGEIVSQVNADGALSRALPPGTLLFGQLWTEGLTKEGDPAVYGRYTEAQLPDGRRFPICGALYDWTGLLRKEPGSKPGAARLTRRSYFYPVRRFP